MDSEISVNSIALSRQGAQIFAIALKPPDAGINSEMLNEIKTLIHEYKNVFPEKLSNGISPFRSKDFPIELVFGAKPQTGVIYRMSQRTQGDSKEKNCTL